MKKYTLYGLILTTICLLIWGQIAPQLTAQEEITPTEEVRTEEDCQSGGLVIAKAEIDLLLEDFDRDVDRDPETAWANLYAVGEAYRQLALDCGYLPENIDTLVINSTDVERILVVLDTLSGDPLRGQLLYNGEEATVNGEVLGCEGCHEAGAVAPPTTGTWTRWDEERSQETQFADYTFEQYTVESIVLPWEYFVATYPEYTMPDFYHEQLGYQDLADIVAFLNSQDQLPE